MSIFPGGNALDRQRLLAPRDYAADPTRFGYDTTLVFQVPLGGDQVSMRVAQVQHLLVVRWRSAGMRPSGSWLAPRFGFSKQSWSRMCTGERFAGQTALTALLVAVLGEPPSSDVLATDDAAGLGRAQA